MQRSLAAIVCLGPLLFGACTKESKKKKTPAKEPEQSVSTGSPAAGPLGSMADYNAAPPLAGTIDGVKWTFGKGYAHLPYESDPARKGTLSIDLNPSSQPDRFSYGCNGSGSMSPDDSASSSYQGLSFYVPANMNDITYVKEPATQFPNMVNPPDALFFSFESYAVQADSGTLKIVMRTDSKIMGVIEGKRADDKEYAVTGRFEAEICPATN